MKEINIKASEKLVDIKNFINANKIQREDIVTILYVNAEYQLVYYTK